jgi:hypothetical protein
LRVSANFFLEYDSSLVLHPEKFTGKKEGNKAFVVDVSEKNCTASDQNHTFEVLFFRQILKYIYF